MKKSNYRISKTADKESSVRVYDSFNHIIYENWNRRVFRAPGLWMVFDRETGEFLGEVCKQRAGWHPSRGYYTGCCFGTLSEAVAVCGLEF